MNKKRPLGDAESTLPFTGTSASTDDSKQASPATAKGNTSQAPDATRPLREKAALFPSYNLKDDCELFIPIHGFARFTEEEMALINHPAFQRLGEIYQLGQAHLVFRGATHKRIEHVLGTVCVVQEMIDAVRDSYNRLQRNDDDGLRRGLCKPLSEVECIFTRVAALLHDIGHLPAGHTFEDELKLFGKYGKHDCVRRLVLILDKKNWMGGRD